jgi:hypothetical protein
MMGKDLSREKESINFFLPKEVHGCGNKALEMKHLQHQPLHCYNLTSGKGIATYSESSLPQPEECAQRNSWDHSQLSVSLIHFLRHTHALLSSHIPLLCHHVPDHISFIATNIATKKQS